MGLASAEAAQMALHSMVFHQTPQRRYHSSQYSAHWLIHYSLFNNHATTQEMQLIAHWELPISVATRQHLYIVCQHTGNTTTLPVSNLTNHMSLLAFSHEPATHTNTVRLTQTHTHTLTPLPSGLWAVRWQLTYRTNL